jgi:uncharacterized protein (TIGR02058 family)
VYVDVTVAVPYPETVRQEEVLKVLPVGHKTLQVVQGGLAAPYRGGEGDEILIATAVVRVSIEV